MAALADYDQSRIKWDHRQKILEFLQIKPLNDETRKILKDALYESAKTKEDIVDIINAGIEEMIHNRCELPKFDMIQREAKQARARNNAEIYRKAYDLMGQKGVTIIDLLFKTEGYAGKSAWNTLREDPGKPTLKTARKLLERLTWFQQFQFHGFDLALDDIPYLKFRHLAMEAKSLDAARIRSMSEKKRCTMAASLIRFSTHCTVDDLCEVMIKKMGNIHQQAKERLEQYLKKNQEKLDEMISKYKEIHDKCTGEGTESERLSAISAIFDERPDLVEYTNRHLESAAKNHFRFLWSIFKASRAVFFDILSGLKFLSTSEDAAIERAIEFAKIHRNRRVDLIPLSPEKESKETQLSTMEELSWIPDNWWNFVTDQKRRQQIPSNINRRNFELCLFSQIVLALKSTDIYVENSGQYSDNRSRLVLWDEFDSNIVHYGEMVGLPVEKKCFINYIKELLFKEAEDTDSTYTENQEFNIDDKGIPSLKKLRAAADPDGLKIIEAQLLQRLQPRNILDVLVDTENALNWTRVFGPVSGLKTKLKNPDLAYIVSTFCYGSLLGPSQTERCLPLLDRRQISWVNQRHITEEKLQKAIEIIVNAYNNFVLPKYWGGWFIGFS